MRVRRWTEATPRLPRDIPTPQHAAFPPRRAPLRQAGHGRARHAPAAPPRRAHGAPCGNRAPVRGRRVGTPGRARLLRGAGVTPILEARPPDRAAMAGASGGSCGSRTLRQLAAKRACPGPNGMLRQKKSARRRSLPPAPPAKPKLLPRDAHCLEGRQRGHSRADHMWAGAARCGMPS